MDAKADSHAAGADKWIDSASLCIERMPMLAAIFDRLAAGCAEGLRPFSPEAFSCFVNSIASEHVWDALEAYDGSISAVLHAPEIDARIVIGLDRRGLHALVEVLLGGDGQEPPLDDERAFSPFETRLAETLFTIAADALSAAFETVVPARFQLERIETRMDFAMLGRRNVLAAVARLVIQAMDMGGQIFVVIPQAALAPIRPLLSRDAAADGAAGDPRWRNMLRAGVQKTEVKALAILDEQSLMLGDISSWRIGDVLPLKGASATRVRLDCKQQPLFWCELSQAQGRYSLRTIDRADVEDAPLAQFLASAGAAEQV